MENKKHKMPEGHKFTKKAVDFKTYLKAANDVSVPKTISTGKEKDATGSDRDPKKIIMENKEEGTEETSKEKGTEETEK